MQLRDYVRIIAKRGWITVLVTIITIVSALAFSRIQTPVYRSTVFLNIWPARLDLSLQETIKALMRNYAGSISSRETALTVINELQLDITPDQLREKMTVDPIESDFLIQIDADDYDPLIARDIAQAAAGVFVRNTQVDMIDKDKRDRVEVSMLDDAAPGKLRKPKWKTNLLAGGVFGILMGGLVVFVLEWLEADIIRTSKDIERYTQVAVLGIIPLASGRHTRVGRSGPS